MEIRKRKKKKKKQTCKPKSIRDKKMGMQNQNPKSSRKWCNLPNSAKKMQVGEAVILNSSP